MKENYEEVLQKVLEKIGKRGLVTLATSLNNKTTIRPMSVVLYDGKIAFQTSTELEKYKQIEGNPQVALSSNNIQIVGIANIQEEQSLLVQPFIELFREKHASSYDAYSHMASSRVIEVEPTLITIWDYVDGEPYRTFIDLLAQTVIKEKYNHTIVD